MKVAAIKSIAKFSVLQRYLRSQPSRPTTRRLESPSPSTPASHGPTQKLLVGGGVEMMQEGGNQLLGAHVNQIFINGARVSDAGDGAEVRPNGGQLVHGHVAEGGPRHYLKHSP